MAYYIPGNEPEKIKSRLARFFAQVDEAYPEKKVVGIQNEHKRLGERLTALYRELGYSSGAEMMEAYGYEYLKKSRPTVSDEENRAKFEKIIPDLIKKLQSRCDGPAPNLSELKRNNPDLAYDINFCNKHFPESYGHKSFINYLKSLNIINQSTNEKRNILYSEILNMIDQLINRLNKLYNYNFEYYSIDELCNSNPNESEFIEQLLNKIDDYGVSDKEKFLIKNKLLVSIKNKKNSSSLISDLNVNRDSFEKALKNMPSNTDVNEYFKAYRMLIKRSYGLTIKEYLEMRGLK